MADGQDLTRESADRWIEEETARLVAYDEILARVAKERIVLERGGDAAKNRFPVAAWARSTLAQRLEQRLQVLRGRLH